MPRKKRPEEHVNHERWLVSYADFITLLFAFFTTLYAISTVDQKKAGKLMYSMRTAFNMEFFQGVQGPGTQLVSILELEHVAEGLGKGPLPGKGQDSSRAGGRLQELSRKLGELSLDPALKGKIQVRMEARGLVVSLAEAGFFPSGSAGVRPEAVEPLMALAQSFADPIFGVTVEGHTDNVPVKNAKYASNWELSTARASSVVALFIEKAGISPTRISASGYGEYKPVAANDTVEGRAHNRRVDIVVSPLKTDVPAPESSTPPVDARAP